MRARWLATWSAVIALSGCSIVAVSGPPTVVMDHRDPVSCTTSQVFPVLDAVPGVLGLLLGIYALAQIPSADGEAGPAILIIGSGITLIGASYSVSSIIGFSRVSDCRSVKERLGPPNPEVYTPDPSKSPDQEHSACVASRIEAMREAQATPDLAKRQRLLSALPDCAPPTP